MANDHIPPRALVAGGAGFIGSHLCDRLRSDGYEVVCLDNFVTGSNSNVAHMQGDAFELVHHDVASPLSIDGPITEVYQFASPASPADFLRIPIAILRAGAFGTDNLLQLARQKNARFMLASTSEVYGDALVHPQSESYFGNVNPVGIRSAYDEAKRFAEALTMAYHREHHVDTRIVRIFNTYGPRMREDDGRMIPNFIGQALVGAPMTIFGDGMQTRSLQYVTDLIEGIVRLMRSSEVRPVNIGNPREHTVREIATLVRSIARSQSDFTFHPLPDDDPKQRRPDITRATKVLGWMPDVSAEAGLKMTIEWFANRRGGTS